MTAPEIAVIQMIVPVIAVVQMTHGNKNQIPKKVRLFQNLNKKENIKDTQRKIEDQIHLMTQADQTTMSSVIRRIRY